MGVYIKGMEMPTDHPLWIVVHPDGTVEANEVSPSRPVGWQTLRNAAVPVPPHGRLIDADALTKMCQEMQSIEWNNKASPYSWAYAYESFEGDIDNAPTIIEAEGEEQ